MWVSCGSDGVSERLHKARFRPPFLATRRTDPRKYRTEPDKTAQLQTSQKVSKSPDFSRNQGLMVGEGGFEPPKSLTTDLQSAPFGHSGIPPYTIGAGRRTRTPDLLITNPPHEVKCLILQAFRAFSLHTSVLNQQVLSGESIRSYRPVGQRVGQRFSRVHVSRTWENRPSSLFSPSILRRQMTARFLL